MPFISALCLRSKGHWGYDDAFLENCRTELMLTETHLSNDPVCVAELDGKLVGVVHLVQHGEECELEKLFVEPDCIGKKVGVELFNWAVAAARKLGSKTLTIDSEPYAAGFYQKMGASLVGERPSGSIPGRVLPQYALGLHT